MTSVLDYDLEGLRVSLKKDFSLAELLKAHSEPVAELEFSQLAKFGASLAKDAPAHLLLMQSPGDRRRIGNFLQLLKQVF